MGYIARHHTRPWLVFDLETTAIADLDDYADDLRIDSRLRDPEKIAQAQQAAREKAALDIDLARIVCLGYWTSDQAAPVVLSGDTEDAERDMLAHLWTAYTDIVGRGGTICGFNVLGYDLPLANRRAQYLCVWDRPAIELNKYRPGPVLDLMQYLSYEGAVPARRLAFYCKRFGIHIPDATSGADMPTLIAAGDWDAVRAHCLSDVQRTQALAVRLGLIRPPAEAVVL